MIYDKVKLYFTQNDADAIAFPLDDGILTAPYTVTNIEGLDPPMIDVSIVDRVYEGGDHQSSRPQNRELVMTVEFNPDFGVGQTYGDLRTSLNRLLTPKLRKDVGFYLMSNDETSWVGVSGYLKNVAATPFSANPSLQMTIATDSPFLSHGLKIYPSPNSLPKNPITFTNEGDAPSGFGITFVLTANASSFTLSNEDSTESISATYAFLTGDKIWINTIMGERYFKMERGATSVNLLRYMAAGSDWMQLVGGVNKFVPSTQNFTLENLWWTPRRWGV